MAGRATAKLVRTGSQPLWRSRALAARSARLRSGVKRQAGECRSGVDRHRRSGQCRRHRPSRGARYNLLLRVRAGLPSAVTDLAVASGFNDATVSQALRLLRAAGAVAAARDRRTMRYTVADPAFVRSLPAEPDEAATACALGPRQLHRP